VQHPVVGGVDDGGERIHAARLGELGEVGEQYRADSASLPGVVDLEGDLGAAGPVRHEAGVRHRAPRGAGERKQGDTVGRQTLGRAAEPDPGPEEAQPECIGREALEQVAQEVGVVGACAANVGGRAVAQDDLVLVAKAQVHFRPIPVVRSSTISSTPRSARSTRCRAAGTSPSGMKRDPSRAASAAVASALRAWATSRARACAREATRA
jgi:hypothetical protein